MVEVEMADLTLESPSAQLHEEMAMSLSADEGLNEANGTSKPAITVSKPIPYTFDLGNLLCNDANPLPENCSNTEIDAAARDCAQGLINQLLTTCPINSTTEGVYISLPQPTFPLPREKPIPMPKEPTKWEKFAAKKGIIGKRKEGNKVYDEEKGEWVPRWGYGGKNKSGENDWLVEVDEKKERQTGEAGDVRQEKRAERKDRVRRQERKERANEKKQGRH